MSLRVLQMDHEAFSMEVQNQHRQSKLSLPEEKTSEKEEKKKAEFPII
jgi:hypothetical protein